MESYRLYTVIPRLIHFLEQLTNWYVRLNRQRIKGDNGPLDMKISLNVLFEVLYDINLLMSPIVPFITDMFYQNMKVVLNQ